MIEKISKKRRLLIEGRDDPDEVTSVSLLICNSPENYTTYDEIIGVSWIKRGARDWLKIDITVDCNGEGFAQINAFADNNKAWRRLHGMHGRFMQTKYRKNMVASDFHADVMELLRIASLLLTEHRMIREVDRGLVLRGEEIPI